MLDKFKFNIKYKHNGYNMSSDKTSCEHYEIKKNIVNNRLKISITPKDSIELISASLTYDYMYGEKTRVFSNGYQSWSTSREYKKTDRQKGLMGLGKIWPIKKFTEIFGDYTFIDYPNRDGIFHSFSYGYIKDDDDLFLIGSLTERQGYTIIWYDMIKNTISIDKDVEGVTIVKEYNLYDIFTAKGSCNEVFDKYFSAMDIKKPKKQFMCGYTSWYNYFGKITEKIITRDLDGLSTLGDMADIFQIDDGYQTAVGDWLSVDKEKFPNGMKYLADKIHSNGYLAGIWLAPFNAQKSSKIVKEHKDWLVKDKNGKNALGSIAWGGAYTLDFYNEEAAKYIKKVFHTVVREWGYDLVKLDFLYSECIQPRYNKSRGQIMCEAMDFLRECVGDDKYILGCGVPLAPSFGLVDFCRISCDVELTFKDKFYVKHSNQEIVCTRSAMNNTIFRRHLDGRAFVNDPDVFFLRENDLTHKDPLFVKRGKLKFTWEQKKLLAKINNMCGNVLFVSDNIGDYNNEQLEVLKEMFEPSKLIVLDAEYISSDDIVITYMDKKEMYKLHLNIATGENKTIRV
ncbi:MAG: glycoside hydrolase family 36 protein [Bacillota bacterium]